MATIKEIMQQALDALKTCGYDFDREESIYKTYDVYQIDLAIEALEAELAKPEQEPVAWMWKDGTITTDPERADGTWTKLYALGDEK